jgi:hypothetical protein
MERWPGGRIRNLEVSLTLKEWVEPSALTASQRQAKAKAKAVKKKGQTVPASTQWKTNTNSEGYQQRVPSE